VKPAVAFNQPQPPSSWQDLPCGELILSTINEHMDNWWGRMFGYHLLKIGNLSAVIDSQASMINHQVEVIDKDFQQGVSSNSRLIAENDDLPFLKHSVDIAILSHALEFAVDPHHVIREANRVVIPNGYMVITGYNPLSLAGLNKLIPFRRGKTPWSGRFFTPMRVKDWLNLMGYEIVDDTRLLPYFLNKNSRGHSWCARKWQSFAEHYFSAFGSVYIIIAKKRKLPLTPIKPKWLVRPKFTPVNVSSMNRNL
jgi:ubiquinone/menaquinone biosynthesis C-methylase UbiE